MKLVPTLLALCVGLAAASSSFAGGPHGAQKKAGSTPPSYKQHSNKESGKLPIIQIRDSTIIVFNDIDGAVTYVNGPADDIYNFNIEATLGL